jgi:predicted nucleic acid-binding protein
VRRAANAEHRVAQSVSCAKTNELTTGSAVAMTQSAPQLLARLAADEAEVLAPRLLMEEVSNALLTGIRRGRWSGQAADGARRLLRRLPVRLADEPRDLDRAWDLARRYDAHPVYDMVYVALAECRGTQLVTADPTLRTLLGDVDWVVAPEALLR